MTWNIAAGIIIGGGILAVIIDGAKSAGSQRMGMSLLGWFQIAVGIGFALWVLLSKAHYS